MSSLSGVFLSATDSLNWWAAICNETPQKLTEELGQQIKPASDLTFLPYLSGERTPHNDAKVRGAFVGLDHSHNRAHMTQAVLEGVAFALKDSLLALTDTGTSVNHVFAVGGGTASNYWLGVISTILQLPVYLPQGSYLGAALGAARLGLMAAESLTSKEVCSSPHIAKTFVPSTKLGSGFEEAFLRYGDLYPAIGS
jgi:xylulokinase